MAPKGPGIMAVILAGMLLLQFGVNIIYGIGTLGGQEVPPDTRAEIGEMNASVCAVAAIVAALLAFSSFVEQRTRSKRLVHDPGDNGPGGPTTARVSYGTRAEAVVYLTIVAIIAGWGVWTTLWYRHG